MATKGERQALLFLAAVALLGAATRVYRAQRPSVATETIDRQIDAVAGARPRGRGRARGQPGATRQHLQTKSDSVDPSVSAFVAVMPSAPTRIDLDMATAAEIERLPGVGPAMAKRIVADRNAHGTFGCIAALDSVKGIGPAMMRRLDSLVTFSRTPRAVCGSR